MDKEIIKFDIIDFKKIKTLEDFYIKVGLMNRIINEGLTQFDIHMNRWECELLNDYLKYNNKKSLTWSITLHWLNYSPTTNNKDIPKGELWIYKENV